MTADAFHSPADQKSADLGSAAWRGKAADKVLSDDTFDRPLACCAVIVCLLTAPWHCPIAT